jgi:hypothetical protein
MDLSSFYTGSMAPPTKQNGKLVPTPIAEMFSEKGGGLTTRKVQTVPIGPDGNPITATQAISAAAPTGTTYFPPGPEYGYNATTGNYEVQQPGQTYSMDGGKPNFQYPVGSAPQTDVSDATKKSIGAMFGPAFTGGWGSRTPMQWDAVAPAGPAPGGDPWQRDRTPSGGRPGLATGSRSGSISQMYGTPASNFTSSGRTKASVGETFDSVWDEAKG